MTKLKKLIDIVGVDPKWGNVPVPTEDPMVENFRKKLSEVREKIVAKMRQGAIKGTEPPKE